MKKFNVYSSIDEEEWSFETTTTDPNFIKYLNSIDGVLYWRAVEIEEEEEESDQ